MKAGDVDNGNTNTVLDGNNFWVKEVPKFGFFFGNLVEKRYDRPDTISRGVIELDLHVRLVISVAGEDVLGRNVNEHVAWGENNLVGVKVSHLGSWVVVTVDDSLTVNLKRARGVFVVLET